MTNTPAPSPEATNIDHSEPQSGVKPANTTKIISVSDAGQHVHGGAHSHKELVPHENPKEGRITEGTRKGANA